MPSVQLGDATTSAQLKKFVKLKRRWAPVLSVCTDRVSGRVHGMTDGRRAEGPAHAGADDADSA